MNKVKFIGTRKTNREVINDSDLHATLFGTKPIRQKVIAILFWKRRKSLHTLFCAVFKAFYIIEFDLGARRTHRFATVSHPVGRTTIRPPLH